MLFFFIFIQSLLRTKKEGKINPLSIKERQRETERDRETERQGAREREERKRESESETETEKNNITRNYHFF